MPYKGAQGVASTSKGPRGALSTVGALGRGPTYVRVTTPANLDLALEGLVRKVLREQPKQEEIYSFAAEYFETLVEIRDRAENPNATLSEICPNRSEVEAGELIKLASTFAKPIYASHSTTKRLSAVDSKSEKTSDDEPNNIVEDSVQDVKTENADPPGEDEPPSNAEALNNTELINTENEKEILETEVEKTQPSDIGESIENPVISELEGEEADGLAAGESAIEVPEKECDLETGVTDVGEEPVLVTEERDSQKGIHGEQTGEIEGEQQETDEQGNEETNGEVEGDTEGAADVKAIDASDETVGEEKTGGDVVADMQPEMGAEIENVNEKTEIEQEVDNEASDTENAADAEETEGTKETGKEEALEEKLDSNPDAVTEDEASEEKFDSNPDAVTEDKVPNPDGKNTPTKVGTQDEGLLEQETEVTNGPLSEQNEESAENKNAAEPVADKEEDSTTEPEGIKEGPAEDIETGENTLVKENQEGDDGSQAENKSDESDEEKVGITTETAENNKMKAESRQEAEDVTNEEHESVENNNQEEAAQNEPENVQPEDEPTEEISIAVDEKGEGAAETTEDIAPTPLNIPGEENLSSNKESSSSLIEAEKLQSENAVNDDSPAAKVSEDGARDTNAEFIEREKNFATMGNCTRSVEVAEVYNAAESGVERMARSISMTTGHVPMQEHAKELVENEENVSSGLEIEPSKDENDQPTIAPTEEDPSSKDENISDEPPVDTDNKSEENLDSEPTGTNELSPSAPQSQTTQGNGDKENEENTEVSQNDEDFGEIVQVSDQEDVELAKSAGSDKQRNEELVSGFIEAFSERDEQEPVTAENEVTEENDETEEVKGDSIEKIAQSKEDIISTPPEETDSLAAEIISENSQTEVETAASPEEGVQNDSIDIFKQKAEEAVDEVIEAASSQVSEVVNNEEVTKVEERVGNSEYTEAQEESSTMEDDAKEDEKEANEDTHDTAEITSPEVSKAIEAESEDNQNIIAQPQEIDSPPSPEVDISQHSRSSRDSVSMDEDNPFISAEVRTAIAQEQEQQRSMSKTDTEEDEADVVVPLNAEIGTIEELDEDVWGSQVSAIRAAIVIQKRFRKYLEKRRAESAQSDEGVVVFSSGALKTENSSTDSSSSANNQRDESNFELSRLDTAIENITEENPQSATERMKVFSATNKTIDDGEVWETLESELGLAASTIQHGFKDYKDRQRERLRREDAVQITSEDSESSPKTSPLLGTGEMHDIIIPEEH